MRLEASDLGTDKVVKAQLVEMMCSIPATKGQLLAWSSLVQVLPSCQALTSSMGLVVVGIFWRVWMPVTETISRGRTWKDIGGDSR